MLTDLYHFLSSSAVKRGVQANNLYLAKTWLHSSQPMTRSHSSELRKRYVASQNSQTAFGMEAMQNINVSGHSIGESQQNFANLDGSTEASCSDIPNQLNVFMSALNSSPSNYNVPRTGTVDNVSSLVSMLKGTLERKWLSNQKEKSGVDSSLGYYSSQELIGDPNLDQRQERHIYDAKETIHDATTLQVLDPGVPQRDNGLMDKESEEVVARNDPVQMNIVSREQSQSESSAGTPAISIGFDACENPSNSGQARSNCRSSRQQVGNRKNSGDGIKAKDIKEHIYDTRKEDCKKGGLVRYGSVTSADSDKRDPTKKRRVEWSRKMAEAKERVLTPAIPSDMRSVLKRCENLEKEVRSLRLNLSFMNRKDSEQTKQIEELHNQNGELTVEKERLLEDIERIVLETRRV